MRLLFSLYPAPPIKKMVAIKNENKNFPHYSLQMIQTAQDRSPFCIFHIMDDIWQQPELIDILLVGNH